MKTEWPDASNVLSDASTRSRVTHSVLRHGPSTASELAARLGLTTAAIRRHLGLLVDTGVLVSRPKRMYGPRGRGRPSTVFELTDAGRQQFEHAYERLAVDALGYLEQVAGPEALATFGRDLAARTEARFDAIRAAGVPRLQALIDVLDSEGFIASVRPGPGGGVQVCLHHCPVAKVAARFPGLCEAETAMFSRMLNSHVQRLATIAHGDGVCTTNVPQVEDEERKVTV